VSDLLAAGALFHNAILGGLGVALLCSLLGIYLVLRRLVLIGVALPQASAAGIAAVFWLTGHGHAGAGETHALALAGSLVATFGALALLVVGRRSEQIPAEWGIGVLFAVASASTILFVAIDPTGDIEMASLLRGELLTITDADLRMLGVVLFAVAVLFFLFRRDLLLCSFDAEFARTLGRNPVRYDLLLYFLIGGGVALGVITAGPLVVFGFLVLPALAALRLASGLGAAVAISAVVAAASFLGGFAISYRADLPAGPVCVAVAAAGWAASALLARLRARHRARAALLRLVAVVPWLSCASRWNAAAERANAPLPRGTLPEALASQPIAVLPFANTTGQALRMPQGILTDAGRAIGRGSSDDDPTVAELLTEQAAVELARRGYQVLPQDEVRSAVPDAIAPPLAAAGAAARAGIDGPVLAGTLQRFTLTQTGLLLVRLELVLIDARSQEVLWTGTARRPVPIRSALGWQEILLDAGPPIFADAFGNL
jgi:ABC-type Mn2+/Zn2+ transport system permease subunit